MNQKQPAKTTKRLAMDIRPAKKSRVQTVKKSIATASVKTVIKKSKVSKIKKTKKSRPSLAVRNSWFKKLTAHPLKNHPFALPALTFVALSFFAMIAYVVSNGNTLGPSDTKLVYLKVDDTEQTVPTRASNIKELLDKLDITVSEQDVISPSLDTEIVDGQTSVQIYKARPITIIDGDTEISAVAAGPTPREAVSRAGITIYPEDKLEAFVEAIETEDILRGQPVAQRFIIDRATPLTINLYGSTIPIRTHVMTVGDALKEKNIQTQADDVVTPSADTTLTPQTQIFITRVGTSIEAREEVIPMPIETIEDPTLTLGRTVVRQEGNDGRKVVTYQIDLQNGKEVARTPIQEIIAVDAVKKIVIKGTKQPTIIVAGDHAALMLQAGIPESQHASAEYIISRESGWRLNAQNSGGCLGLGQACPGSKLVKVCPDYANDAQCQLRFFTGYVNGRYGSWNGAYQFWIVNHWY